MVEQTNSRIHEEEEEEEKEKEEEEEGREISFIIIKIRDEERKNFCAIGV